MWCPGEKGQRLGLEHIAEERWSLIHFFILKSKALEAKQSSRTHNEELSPSLDLQSPGLFPRGDHACVSFQRDPMRWQADIAFVCMFPLIVKSTYRKIENMVK